MSWDAFVERFNRQSKKYTRYFLPQHRVDVGYDDQPLHPGEAYCQLLLVEMRLARDIRWGDTLYPVVHTAVRHHYGNTLVTVPYVADPGILKDLSSKNLDKVMQYNHELTPRFPFNKGTVSIQAGLFSVVTDSVMKTSVKVMAELTKVLPVSAQFEMVAKLATPIYNGIQDLLHIEDNQLEIGYLQTFAAAGSGGSNELRPGYFVAILAEEGKIDTDALCIVDDGLRVGARGSNKEFLHDHTPLTNYSYMLFRLEVRKQLDWNQFADIDELVQKAQDAVLHKRHAEVKDYLLPNIGSAIMHSPDIASQQRHDILARVEQELQRTGLQATQGEVPIKSLYAIMQQPLLPTDPQFEAEFARLQALFSDE